MPEHVNDPTWPKVHSGTCDFGPGPHPGSPCGRRVITGVTQCSCCGNFDGSPECEAAGCWQPMTVADLLIDDLSGGSFTVGEAFQSGGDGT